MLRWTRGNDATLKLWLYERDGDRLIPFSVSAAKWVTVRIARGTSVSMRLDILPSEDADNCIILQMPATLTSGLYSMEVTAVIGDMNVRSFEGAKFKVVEDNQGADITTDMQRGPEDAETYMEFQFVPQAVARGKNAYEMWHELPGNEHKTMQDYIDEVLNLNEIAEIGGHPDYVGPDYYIYRWDHERNTYYRTDIYVKGESGSDDTRAITNWEIEELLKF